MSCIEVCVKDKYDVIIIGAGVAGLVAGSYLAKAGLKVLILEKNTNPGGYCVSFKRGPFLFDAGPHSLGSCRNNGQIGKLIKDLALQKYLRLVRKDPSDIVVTKDFEIAFYADTKKTAQKLQTIFPKEKINIKKFFDLLQVPSIGFLYKELKEKTFDNLLLKYFNDKRLRTVFSILLGNLGIPARDASAFTSAILYREYILDGGYYPIGGLQAFSDSIANRFEEYGGEIRYSCEVSKIIVSNGIVKGAELKTGDIYLSKYVISCCDASHTYHSLLNKKCIDARFSRELNKLIPSSSFFSVYLGLKKNMLSKYAKCSTLWYFPAYDLDAIYKKVANGAMDLKANYLVCGFPANQGLKVSGAFNMIYLLVLAPFKDLLYWKHNRDRVINNLIDRADALIPGLSENISTISSASPQTFYEYTYNKAGSISGWASTPSQININAVPMQSTIKNLFLAGHWVSSSGGQGGIPMVVYSGKQVAKRILEKKQGV